MFLVPPDLGRDTGPSRRAAVCDVLLYAIAPGIVLWAAISALGKLITGPLKSWNHSESDLNRSLQGTRTQTWDSITAIWSHIGNTEIIISLAVVAVVLVYWRTRRWWFAVIPAIAISLQAAVFVAATLVTGRPRPDVPHLDPAPPTSSYPSGHVGATVAPSPRWRSWPRRSSGPGCAGP